MSQSIENQIQSILNTSQSDKSLEVLLEERRNALGLSFKQCSNVLSIDYNTLKAIIKGKSQKIDYLNVIKLCQFLKLDFDDFTEIFYSDDTSFVREIDKVRKNTFLVNNFDLKNLKKEGFISSITDLQKIRERIKTFFNYEDIFEYNDETAYAMFSSSKLTPSQRMKRFWVKSSYSLFKKIDNPNDYDRNSLKQLIPKIRPYTQYVDDGLKHVSQALFNIGITLIFQPYLKKTSIRGGTFVVNNKPCIVITDFNKYYPTLWFALMHELHHVLFDLEFLRKNNKFHLTGDNEPDLFLTKEKKANKFAREYLFSKKKSNFIRSMINDHNVVKRYAEKNEIHPSIIYAFFQFDQDSNGHNFWGAFRKYFPDVKRAIKDLNLIPWKQDTISDSVEDLKLTLTE